MEPLYDYVNDLPGMDGQIMPYLPPEVARRYAPMRGTFDAGRGCPFRGSFCTIINVQGRKSRFRSPDDVERLLRANLIHGTRHYFITDDNFARNRNWEPIFDRIAAVREELGVKFNFTIQVDTMCHTLPGFVDKARAAGVSRVFIGLENIKRELPLDILEFFCLTPLPGSADHKALHLAGAPLDPDMNIYDLEHVCTTHPKMSKEEWEGIYRAAWDSYYSMEHLETLMRRAAAFGRNPKRIMEIALEFYGCFRFERVHPLQGGFIRRKVRAQRRPGYPIENPFVFYPRRVMETAITYGGLIAYALRVWRLYKRVRRETNAAAEPYVDDAIRPHFEPAAEEPSAEQLTRHLKAV